MTLSTLLLNFTSYLIHRNEYCEPLRVLSIVPNLQNAQKLSHYEREIPLIFMKQ